MKKKIKKQWIEALRSGIYKQGYEELRSGDRSSYCCLGVLCDLYDKAHKRTYWKLDPEMNVFTMMDNWQFLPHKVVKWAGLESCNPEIPTRDGKTYSLSELNDNLIDFNEIATIIERNL